MCAASIAVHGADQVVHNIDKGKVVCPQHHSAIHIDDAGMSAVSSGVRVRAKEQVQLLVVCSASCFVSSLLS